jgi:hypothetical protein
MAALLDGWSLQVQKSQNHLPQRSVFRRLAALVSKLTGYPLNTIDLFVSPGRSQAIGMHTDPEHTLTFQVQGAKHWRVWTESVPPESADMEFTMVPSTVAYVPPWLKHEVATCEEPSVSIVLGFGLLSYDLLWQCLLDDPSVAPIYQMKIVNAAREDRVDDLAASLHPFLEAVRTRFNALSARELAEQLIIKRQNVEVPYRSFDPASLNSKSDREGTYKLVAEFRNRLSKEDQKVVISFKDGGSFRAPVQIETELRWILSQYEPFSASDVPTALPGDRVNGLLSKLANVGVLKVG